MARHRPAMRRQPAIWDRWHAAVVGGGIGGERSAYYSIGYRLIGSAAVRESIRPYGCPGLPNSRIRPASAMRC